MMIDKKFVALAVCFFIAVQSPALFAVEAKKRGTILRFNGDVEVLNAAGKSRAIQETDEKLNENDTIITGQGGGAVVQFDDGALSVLDEKSRLRVEETNWFSYLGGKVYFTFKKVFGESRNIKTRNTTIGVRGTTFIISEKIDANGEPGESVALKEGLLQIESNGAAFEIHKQKIINEFDLFQREQQQAKAELKKEFDRYRQQTNNEFVEYHRDFTLQSNRVINLSGYRVDEVELTAADTKDFESFEAEAEDLIKIFRAKLDDTISAQKQAVENAADLADD